MAGGDRGDMLETFESSFDVSSVTASEHPKGKIKASSFVLEKLGAKLVDLGLRKQILSVYDVVSEPIKKAPLAGRIFVDGNSSSATANWM